MSEPQTSKANLASSGNANTGGLVINANASSCGIQEPKNEKIDDIIQEFDVGKEGVGSKSQGSTPINQGRRKDSTDTNNSQKPVEIDTINSSSIDT